jgi:ubiquinone/menaquinone biosynthesis C-methylase UbiE
LQPIRPDAAWSGPRPLRNPLSVERLGEIYSRTAAFYDDLVAAQQSSAKLHAIEMLARQPGERFLELGCGTGWALRRVIEASGVECAFGLDIAAGMLTVARDAVAQRDAAGRPGLLLGDARALPISSASIDCLLSSYTLEVLPVEIIPVVLQEVMRVLRPGGRAVIVNLTDQTDDDEAGSAMIDDWKQRYVDDPEFFGGARPLQLQSTLEAQGFEHLTRRYVGPDWPSEVLLAYKPA